MIPREVSSFDRGDVLSRIQMRIKALEKGYRQNLGIVGPSGIGKSQVFSGAYKALSQDSNQLVIFFSAEVLNFSHFIERWIGCLLTSVLKINGTDHPYDLEELITKAAETIPQTLEKIHALRKMAKRSDRPSSVLKELFALTGSLAEELNKNIILMIDEFDKFEYLPTSDPFAIFGREMMLETRTLYLVASSKPERAREIFKDKLSLLFGNFEVIELEPLSQSDLQIYVKENYPGYIFSDHQLQFLLNLSGGVPLYTELMLDQISASFPVSHVVEDPAKRFEVPTERMLSAITRELFNQRGRLALMFERKLQVCKRLAKDGGPYVHALLAISHGHRRIQSIAAFVNRKQSETRKVLEKLLKDEIVIKRGSFYWVDDYLFNFWLREIHSRRVFSYRFDEIDEYVRLSETMNNFYGSVVSDNYSRVLMRIEKMFTLFKNDLIEYQGKKWKNPHFHDVQLQDHEGAPRSLTAKGHKVKWLCQIENRFVTEDDIIEFTSRIKRKKGRVKKKLLILLGEIDQNAKLMAHEEKITLWDLKTINMLLDLYNLPKVMIHQSYKPSHEVQHEPTEYAAHFE